MPSERGRIEEPDLGSSTEGSSGRGKTKSRTWELDGRVEWPGKDENKAGLEAKAEKPGGQWKAGEPDSETMAEGPK